MRQLRPIKEQLQALVETRDVVLVEALECRITHVLGQVFKGCDFKEIEQPVGQY